jgi:SAM-dependent methyltransferase
MYLAANISNPVAAPFLILAELQAGAWIRRGRFHPLTIEAVRTTDPWTFGADFLVGSLAVGSALGVLAGVATWLSVRGTDGDRYFATLVRRAADRYASSSITAWEFARGKLRGDPLYRTVVMEGMLPSGGALVDVGCGQGLMLALLAEVARDAESGAWQGRTSPPVFDRLLGIETRPRVAALARHALGGSADIVTGDARERSILPCRVVLFFDVLHMMPFADQRRLLERMAAVLERDGVILVREADAGAGWKFHAVRAGNRVKAVLFGNWRQTFHYRTAGEWTRCFEQLGFQVRSRETAGETPFANVLFVLTAIARASG